MDGTCSNNPYTGAISDILNRPADGIFPDRISDSFLNTEKTQLADNKKSEFYDVILRNSGARGYLQPRPSVSLSEKGSTPISDLERLTKQDNDFLVGIKKEYCEVYRRYKFILEKLLESIAPGSSSSLQSNSGDYLDKTVELNRRLNAMIQMMDYVALNRITNINGTNSIIDTINNRIKTDQPTLLQTSKVLQEQNAIINTQKEMINYTKEKNNNITNQISLWASLNILAIATIFHVYRRM